MNDALFNNNDIDFSRFQKRCNIVVKMSKHYEFSQSKNDELIVISSNLIFKFKKRIQITHTFINDENDIQTSIKKLKFAIKFQAIAFSIMSQLFVIKKRNFFQKSSFKRSTFDDLSFFSTRVIIQTFTSTFFTSKLFEYLQSFMLNQKNQINQFIAKINRLKKKSIK